MTHADLIQRLRESADFYERSAADALVVTTLREAADALCMDWERRVGAYKKGYSDGRNERDCDPGAALDDAR